jgi:hypothetical protein
MHAFFDFSSVCWKYFQMALRVDCRRSPARASSCNSA